MNERFRMQIQEVFHFEDGKTVFAGKVTEGPKFIRPGIFELSVDGDVVGNVRIDGERSRGRVPGVRSVSATQAPSFDCAALKGCDVTFHAIANQAAETWMQEDGHEVTATGFDLDRKTG